MRGIQNSKFDKTVIRFVVELCHGLNILVCLEGIKTEEECQVVQPMRPNYFQGYYFGHPVGADIFERSYLLPGKVLEKLERREDG